MATTIASANGYQGEGPAPASQAFAAYRGVSFRSALKFLNNQDLPSVKDFVQLCNRMTPQHDGNYPNHLQGDAQYEERVAAIERQMQNGSFEVPRYSSGTVSHTLRGLHRPFQRS